MKLILAFFAAAAAGLVLSVVPVDHLEAQTLARKGSFQIDHYYQLMRVNQLALSPDGSSLAYIVQKASLHSYFTSLMPPEELRTLRAAYLLPLNKEATPKLVDELADAQSLTWVPRSQKLAYLATRNGAVAQLYTYDVTTGKSEQVTRSSDQVAAYKYAPDGVSLAYMTREADQKESSYYEQFRTATQGIIADSDNLSSHDFVNPFWNALLRPGPAALWVMAGARPPIRVPVPGEVGGYYGDFAWSSDASALSVTFVDAKMPPSLLGGYRTSLGVYALRGGEFRVLGKANAPTPTQLAIRYGGGEWIPGQNKLMVRRITERDPWVSPSFPDWLVMDANGALPTDVAAWKPVETYGLGTRFLPQTPVKVLLERTSAGVHTLFELTPTGAKRSEWVKDLDGSSSDFQFSRDFRRAVFVNESLTRPPEIYLRDAGGAARKLTRLNDSVAQAVGHTARALSWRSVDGITVRGWLLEPAGSQGPWPMITHIHGGPGMAYPDAFTPYYEVWSYPFEVQAAQGMAIFLPNYRGTMTYGRDFGTPSRTDKEPVEDIITGVQALIDAKVADPKRLGITGQSHGSWLGPLAMAKHRIFRASSFAEGISNLFLMSELMSDDLNREVHDPITGGGVSLYESPKLYIEGSPDLFFQGLRTACLFEAGAYGNGVGMLGFPKAARRGGAPAELIIYPQTDHNPGTLAIQRQIAKRNLDWFDFWLNGQENPEPLEPQQYARWRQMRDALKP